MTSVPAHRARRDLAPADAALAEAVTSPPDDLDAPHDLDGLAAAVGTTRALLEAVARSGLLLPHHVDADGTARYSAADAAAVEAGLTLLDAGLPLDELLELARRTDAAIASIAEAAVEAFLRFVRDPVVGAALDDPSTTERLVTAYERMLPAPERLVAHHLRRRLVGEAVARIAESADVTAEG
jgi:DNA-binding transcriptional MerR regulator